MACVSLILKGLELGFVFLLKQFEFADQSLMSCPFLVKFRPIGIPLSLGLFQSIMRSFNLGQGLVARDFHLTHILDCFLQLCLEPIIFGGQPCPCLFCLLGYSSGLTFLLLKLLPECLLLPGGLLNLALEGGHLICKFTLKSDVFSLGRVQRAFFLLK